MKRFIIFVGVILLFTLFSACSSQPSLQLINSNVSIVNDKSKLGSIVITAGDKKGQELVPTALYYEFTIKNAGNKSIGSMEKDKDLQIKIVPNNKLETTSKEVVGFNIFNPSSYVGTGVGHGYSFTPILKAGQEGKFILNYDLGVSEKDPQVPLMIPSSEKLKKLQDDALDASLVVMLEGTEVARFALIKK
ncbi:MAG: hypothetical protein E7211_09190 [Clostridium lundense]|nr:hypothetical protein [Clostridium lundense]